MKITKLIREYVEDEVNKVFNAKQNPFSEQAARDREMILAFKEELKAAQQVMLDKFVADNHLMKSDGSQLYKAEASVPSLFWAQTAAMRNEVEWKTNNKQERSTTIKRILTALELGANRQDLHNMLAELKEKVE